MKRFWLVLLALGILFAFSSSVFAADVKFSGSFYAAGMYQDNTTIDKDGQYASLVIGPDGSGGTTYATIDNPNASTAFYYQRLRVQMDFIATPYLKLITRFDAMERIWGGARSAASGAQDIDGSMGSRNENQNIAFDYAYLWFVSKIGIWSVGYMEDAAWGTEFANNSEPEAKITWMLVKMPIIAGLQIVKFTENDTNMINGYTGIEDADVDKYQGFVIYNFKGGQVGLLGVAQFYGSGGNAYFGDMGSTEFFVLQPFVKAKIGPVAIEAEVDYMWGKWFNSDTAGMDDVKISNLEAYVSALADFGMFYVGGTLAFMDGDKQSTNDKIEGGLLSGGRDWNPCLLMFNWDRYYWAGPIGGPAHLFSGFLGTIDMAAPMNNAYFAQIKAGVRPIADLDIMASVSYADAVRTATLNDSFTGFAGIGNADLGNNEEYGWEVDVTATYKITNNLTYMLGAGYWFVGDFYKGLGKAYEVDDNFIVLNKLTLTF